MPDPTSYRVALHPGDCLDVMAGFSADTFDAIVTDPPYHLTPPGNGTTGFMGKAWDGGDIAFRPETWAAALRVAKPGAHLVAFNHSRTWHHMAVAIEAAGWEIRDSLMWLYGSGFPKSHDVSAGIDKIRDDRDDICRVTSWVADHADRRGISRADVDAHMGTADMAGWWLSRLPHRCAIPTPAHWLSLSAFLDLPADMDAEVARLNARKGTLGEVWQEAEIVGRHAAPAQVAAWRQKYAGSFAAPAGAIRAANSEAAKRWAGHGTALKPAFEPIVLARKPIAESSIARQYLATGTGGLNIDAARIAGNNPGKSRDGEASASARYAVSGATNFAATPGPRGGDARGRWPANVVHDGSPEVMGRFPVDGSESAARFFYCAKADAGDRAGSDHPTVKPLALMRWLVRLTSARGGRILDPFGGSGSTAWAAALEGRVCDLIEREEEYCAHIRHRLPDFDPAALARRAEDEARAPASADLPAQGSLL